jgi:hypothetical protein
MKLRNKLDPKVNQLNAHQKQDILNNGQHNAIMNKIYVPIVHKRRMKTIMIEHKGLGFEKGYK